jgi:hypothetical protein
LSTITPQGVLPKMSIVISLYPLMICYLGNLLEKKGDSLSINDMLSWQSFRKEGDFRKQKRGGGLLGRESSAQKHNFINVCIKVCTASLHET